MPFTLLCSHFPQSIFASLLQGATVVTIQDPYIQAHHQCQNLVRLCEVFARHSDSLRTVNLTTKACDEGAARKSVSRPWQNFSPLWSSAVWVAVNRSL